MEDLYKELEKYRDSDYYPFHMPGHKRNPEAADGALADCYGLDITEIEGFDSLHQAEGILQREQRRVTRLYGSTQSYFLVNGSTCGILSAVFAVTKDGDRILMARNCHKSVYHAVYLRKLAAVYLQPDWNMGKEERWPAIAGRILPEAVEDALKKHPDCAAVVITSPTYEGVASDVGKIALIAHAHKIPLIVDEAHGAHFGFHEAFPCSSVRLGADLVIHSTHKTLPAMTQTALLHWNQNEKQDGSEALWDRNGSLVDRKRLERYLRIFQTSSPSYPLMASISNSMRLMEREGWAALDRLARCREAFLHRMRSCHYVRIWEAAREENGLPVGYDPCKLVIGIANGRMTGQELYDILREEYHLQMEMATPDYVLAIVTMMDRQEGWNRLEEALIQIHHRLAQNAAQALEGRDRDNNKRYGCSVDGTIREQEAAMTIAEAYDAAQEWSGLAEGKGRVAAEFINLYPPGVPLAVPGERLTEEFLGELDYYGQCGLKIQGVENGCIKVVRQRTADGYEKEKDKDKH